MPTPTINAPITMKIYKKVGANEYTVYAPYTLSGQVESDTDYTLFSQTVASGQTLASVLGTVISKIGNASTSNQITNSTYSLTAQIDELANNLIGKTGAFVFKGNLTPSGTVSPASDSEAGWVYNVTTPFNINSSGQIVYVSDPKNAQYSAGTNVVVYVDSNTKKYDALAGDMGNHALTSEAVGSLVWTPATATITVKHVDNSTAGTITFDTIGTVAASTTQIVSTITSSTSGSAIPNVAAVRDFAGSAAQIDASPTTSGYVVVVPTNASGAQAAGVVRVAVSGGQNTVPTLAADINGTATWANNAEHTRYCLSIAGEIYDGRADRSMVFSHGVHCTYSASTWYVEASVGEGLTVDASDNITLHVKSTNPGLTLDGNGLAIDPGNGITVDSTGVGIQVQSTNPGLTVTSAGLAADPGTGITLDSNGISIAGTHTISAGAGISVTGTATYRGSNATTTIGLATTGIASGVYSALQVDTYGRASAGAQSFVFAPDFDSSDLNALVVGGLAFIGGTSAQNVTTTYSANGTTITATNIS